MLFGTAVGAGLLVTIFFYMGFLTIGADVGGDKNGVGNDDSEGVL